MRSTIEKLKRLKRLLWKLMQRGLQISGYTLRHHQPAPLLHVQFIIYHDNLPQNALRELYDHIAIVELSGWKVTVEQAPQNMPLEHL